MPFAAVCRCMPVQGWAALCLLGASSLAAVRRRYYNVFYSLHLLLAPIVRNIGET